MVYTAIHKALFGDTFVNMSWHSEMIFTSEVGSEVVSELGSKEGSGQCCKVCSEVGTLN